MLFLRRWASPLEVFAGRLINAGPALQELSARTPCKVRGQPQPVQQLRIATLCACPQGLTLFHLGLGLRLPLTSQSSCQVIGYDHDPQLAQAECTRTTTQRRAMQEDAQAL